MKKFKKIAVIAGTSEATELIEEIQYDFEVTAFTATQLGKDILNGLECHIKTGRLNENEFINELVEYDCVIDASHPFAENVSAIVKKVCENLNIMYLRMGRDNENYNYEKIIYVADKSEVAEYLNKRKNLKILFTTGANTLKYYTENIENFKQRCFSRIIKTKETENLFNEYKKNIVYAMPPFSSEDTEKLIEKYNIDILVSKDSGKRGGLFEKINACKNKKIPVLIIESPEKNSKALSIADIKKELL